MAGCYFEQFEIGENLRHDPHRTITETDNLLITTLTHNPQPLHLDAEYAAGTEFGRIVVNGLLTFALMVGLSVGTRERTLDFCRFLARSASFTTPRCR
jgi:acyl dehydratase